jgi:hypothetical protein
VAPNHLGHQPIDGAPARGHRVQNMRAFGAFLEGSFDSFDLSFDAANPVQELFFVADDMCHLFP